MCKKRIISILGLALLVFCFSLPALACDENRREEIAVQAPLTTVDCSAGTVQLLGLTVDISNAEFGGKWHKGKGGIIDCADLTVTQIVAVELLSDTPDATGNLTATEVKVQHGRDIGVKIAAPLQFVDTSALTVTVLGLSVDISQAELVNGRHHPIDVTQLKVDQFARLTLVVTDEMTLSATELRVHINEVKVQAPIEAVSCDTSPATITMLGLTIDVSKAEFGQRWHNWHGDVITCADLTVTQMVEVYLTSDISDTATGLFTAVEVEVRHGPDMWHGCEMWRDRDRWHDRDRDNGVKIAAPLRAIDKGIPSVTVLGLAVNIGEATLLNQEREPIIIDQLLMGQFTKLTLVSEQAPLAAKTLQVSVNQITVQAPIEALDCTTPDLPPNITMLGLGIDVSNVKFGGGDWHRYECHGEQSICDYLSVGQVVKVELTSDITDTVTGFLMASELNIRHGHDDGVKIFAPLQTIDTSALTVTVLSLDVGIGNAILLDDNKHLVTPDKLFGGQFVLLDLASSQPPLSATKLVAQADATQVHITVLDKKGKKVAGDLRADVTIKSGEQIRQIHSTGNGTIHLTGLPEGKAKIVVTSVQNGQTSKGTASFKVKADDNKSITVRLKTIR
jgi:hypothetical protein